MRHSNIQLQLRLNSSILKMLIKLKYKKQAFVVMEKKVTLRDTNAPEKCTKSLLSWLPISPVRM